MRICNLSSGSDGNSTFVEVNNTRILVDIGLSCKEIENRLLALHVEPSSINAILISHEHNDHIKGLDVFANRYGVKVFVHREGELSLKRKLKKNLNIETFDDVEFFINEIKVKSTPLPHDVERCSGFSLFESEKKFSIFTDMGHTTNEIIENLAGSKLIFLESNHNVQMLLASKKYPIYLKNRIYGDFGHLSNQASAVLIKRLIELGSNKFILSHISKETNTPEIAMNEILDFLHSEKVDLDENFLLDYADIVPRALYRI